MTIGPRFAMVRIDVTSNVTFPGGGGFYLARVMNSGGENQDVTLIATQQG
jgi:hypothetical protein